ncbi:MAG: B12-binding domain-containing radical SAM protein [Acetobacteraceae bacterium]|nr:B12-binding domain-containing radical SAM protein [Acetobacteraceae bacterium]
MDPRGAAQNGMRLALVKPPEASAFNFGAFSLAVLAAAVRDLAEVSILDLSDLPLDRAVSAALPGRPHAVGVTVMGLASVGPAAEFVRRLRAAGPQEGAGRLTILAGGHGASTVPGPLLRAGADAVVFGEGEATLRDIVQHGVGPGLPGTACLDGGRLVLGPPRPPIRPLGRIGPPARDLMPPPPDGVHLLETSRGCPHACTFCETTRFYGTLWRPHTPPRVADEVRRLVNDYGAWTIQFADDNFTCSPQRVLEICERLCRGPLPALILAFARADNLLADPRLIPALARARVLRVTVGVETLEEGVARRAGKPIPLETYREAFSRLREAGAFSVASFIVGLPGESPEMRRRAVELAVEAGPDSAHFLPFIPLPGTPLAGGGATPRALDAEVPRPDHRDAADARRLTAEFRRHPAVLDRLARAAGEGGVRGLLARAALERYREAGRSRREAPGGAGPRAAGRGG